MVDDALSQMSMGIMRYVEEHKLEMNLCTVA